MEFLTKPVRDEDLLKAIGQALERSRPDGPPLAADAPPGAEGGRPFGDPGP